MSSLLDPPETTLRPVIGRGDGPGSLSPVTLGSTVGPVGPRT